MVMPCSAPVSLSRAVTCRIPLASMSKVTSICGSPRGAGRMFSSLNLPSTRLSLAISRSPCSTTISTAGKLCLRDPEMFAAYYGNELIALVSEAWLGPAYQITSQVNCVNPGGAAQTAHRD